MDREKFERLCRKAKMNYVDRMTTLDGEVFIADGYISDPTPEFPNGFFRTMWATERGGLDVSRDLFFDRYHDPSIPMDCKRKARVHAAACDACGWISLNSESGRYAN